MQPFVASSRTRIGWAVCFVCLHLLGFALYIAHLTTGWQFDRQLAEPFQLFNIYWNGVFLLIAFVVAYGLAMTVEVDEWDDRLQEIAHRPLSVLIFGLIGARLLDILYLSPVSIGQGISQPADYFSNPILMFDLNWGGLNIWGAIVLVSLWMAQRSWRKGGQLFSIFLRGTLGLLAGLSLMQWGNFLSQQLYGVPYNGIGAVEIDANNQLPSTILVSGGDSFFPIFLFGAAWYLAGALFMIYGKRWAPQSMRWDQLLFGLAWFVVGRIGLELAIPNTAVNAWFGLLFVLLIFGMGLSSRIRHIGG